MDDNEDYDDDDYDDEYYGVNQYEEQDNFRSNIDGESQLIDPEFFEYECLAEEDVCQKQDNLIKLSNYQLSISENTQEDQSKMSSNINNNNNNNNVNNTAENTASKTITFKIVPKGVGHQTIRCDICMDDKTEYDLNLANTINNNINNINNNNNEIITLDQLDHQQLPMNDCQLLALDCDHAYCKRCWYNYMRIQIQQGISPQIECMSVDCHSRLPDEMIFSLLSNQENSALREKFIKLSIIEFVQSHPKLRYCPGRDCSMIIHSLQPNDDVKDVVTNSSSSSTNISRKVTCKSCQTTFCFNCGSSYHAPTDCLTIKKWLTKCEDDSETSNYISAHTKACPKCRIVIEKNGGCNHMQCFSCKFNFCWICLGDWESHGSEYYECSRYKGNPEIFDGSANSKAYELLKKYLFYYERWDNHAKSLKLEQQTLAKIKQRIQDNVMANKGTWIDWHYLLDAAQLLSKCRYTLQYTYPYAYYLEPGPRKQLFEYQQAQLEAEIENLSWEVERAENTNRGDIENQMSIAEKWRTTLLNDFYG